MVNTSLHLCEPAELPGGGQCSSDTSSANAVAGWLWLVGCGVLTPRLSPAVSKQHTSLAGNCNRSQGFINK